jgi:glyoxylase-like metal-dependent hydrolase (beta-lactamase superfamily II)
MVKEYWLREREYKNMKIEKVKNRSILFTKSSEEGWNLNVHLIIGEKYNYIIDTGVGSSHLVSIMEYIKNDNKNIIVINTHHHWDHIFGNSFFKAGIIVAHKLCKEMIEHNWDDMSKKHKEYIKYNEEMYLPNLLFEHELCFEEDKIRIIHTPGHTVDSISVVDELDKVINVGDNLGDSVEELIPSIYCEKEKYINTLLRYSQMDFDTCISGHNIVMKRGVIDEILKDISKI